MTYTTGSINTTVFSDNDVNYIDTGWNKGQTLPGTYSNTVQDVKFPVHSSYAYPIHINKSDNNVGYLFYNTAENLPGFYSIGYKSALNLDKSASRFMYKVELDSNKQGNLTPVVRSVRFVVND
jgi:hypothetical protein